MSNSLQTQAVLLLTVWFTRPGKADLRPLTPTEWGRFAAWLKSQEKSPEVLLAGSDPMEDLQGWSDRSVTPDRIRQLLERSGALGLALEKWQRAGLWVMTRSDPDYPHRLKKRLKLEAPPVLFGCGDRRLLDQTGVAVVGSRAALEEDLAYASRLGTGIASEGLGVVSGGAKGVDEAAMLGALGKDGAVIGVLAESLLRAATSAKFRQGLMGNRLVLVSPFNPEAGFNVGNAMARNKYIYCLADAGVVVTTAKERGGTWNGAVENLKHSWVPLWVKEDADPESGNAALVSRGARWLSPGVALGDLVVPREPQIPQLAYASAGPRAERTEPPTVIDRLTFYEIFVRRLESLTAKGPVSMDDLLRQMDIGKPQIDDWIKRAEAEGRVSKLSKPVRYVSRKIVQQRLEL